jgi:hypothetical protein
MNTIKTIAIETTGIFEGLDNLGLIDQYLTEQKFFKTVVEAVETAFPEALATMVKVSSNNVWINGYGHEYEAERDEINRIIASVWRDGQFYVMA